jgi:hypothetical protein
MVEIFRREQELGELDTPTADSIARLISLQGSPQLEKDEDCNGWSVCYEMQEIGQNKYWGRIHTTNPLVYLEEHDTDTDQSINPRTWKFEIKKNPANDEEEIFLYQIVDVNEDEEEEIEEIATPPLIQEDVEANNRDEQFDLSKPIKPYEDKDPYVKRIIISPNATSGGLVNPEAIADLANELKIVQDENHSLVTKRVTDSREVLLTRDKPLRDEALAAALEKNKKALEKNEKPIVIVPLLENEDLTGFNLEDPKDKAEYEDLLKQRTRKEKLAELLKEIDEQDERLMLGRFNEDRQTDEDGQDDIDDEDDEPEDDRLSLLRNIFLKEQKQNIDIDDKDDEPEEINEIEEIDDRIKQLIDNNLNRNSQITSIVNRVIEAMDDEDGLVSVLKVGKNFSEAANVRGITRVDLVHRLASVDFSGFKKLRGQYLVQAMLDEIVLEKVLEAERVSLEGGTLITRVYGFLPFKVDSIEIQEALKHKDAKIIFPKIINLIERLQPKSADTRNVAQKAVGGVLAIVKRN